MLVRWSLLGFLTLFAAINSIGIGQRVSTRTAELAIAAATIFFALLAAPVVVLGYANALTATSLGTFAALLNLGIFYALIRGRSVRTHVASCASAVRAVTALPYDALVVAVRGRSLATVGLAVSYAIIVYAFISTVLLPISSWDGFMYHEPIVGFALQNHGFAPIELPSNETLQATNGYPKLCEALSIWFVIFTDRTLVELPNVLAAPPLMLAVYALSRRFGDPILSLAWASVIVLMPQTWVQLCWIYIDVVVAFFAVTAVYFSTRPECRMRDILTATLALGLLAGSKFSALALVPLIGVVASVRLLFAHGRERPVASAAVTVGAAAFLATVAAVPMVHNLRYFRNPIWPVTFDNDRLGIHWAGLRSMREIVADATLRSVVAESYDLPVHGFPDIHFRGYGYAIAWVIVPAAILAVVASCMLWLVNLARRQPDPALRNLIWVIGITVGGVLVTPTLIGRNARYNLHILAGLMAVVTWILRDSVWLRMREGLIGASVVLSLFPLGINADALLRWGMTDNLGRALRDSLVHHSYVTHFTFDRLGKVREAELHSGDRVAFDEDVPFIGALWNFEYSNTLRFLHSDNPAAFLASLRTYDPKWVAVGNQQDQTTLRSSEEWQPVGKLSVAGGDQVVFRRR